MGLCAKDINFWAAPLTHGLGIDRDMDTVQCGLQALAVLQNHLGELLVVDVA